MDRGKRTTRRSVNASSAAAILINRAREFYILQFLRLRSRDEDFRKTVFKFSSTNNVDHC